MSSSDQPTPPPPPPPPQPQHEHGHGNETEEEYYFCHQCNRTISIPIPPPSSSSTELSCPRCHGGFLEQVNLPSPPSLPPLHHPFPFLSPSSSDFNPFNPVDLSSLFSPSPSASSATAAAAATGTLDPAAANAVFDPFTFLHNYLHSMRSGGANVQFVIQNSGEDGSPPGFRIPAANLGDYFFGPGLEQLIQQLAENDPNRYGTPPAAKSAVEGLPTVDVTEEMLQSDSSHCAVCMDEFELGAQVKELPCNHVYHKDCIVPWLELHNSCPVCRYELPTDDPDYEQRSRGVVEGGEGESSGVGGGDQVSERQFQISLPLMPFLDGGENPNFESETRAEDLD
ncbi:E3 ubiquitin-protein ligase RING1-like [Silene latifolia]|uniref:E3 ubiquitin-protein ligase RING1-like n=1 Tax=Silene latifolia TaxID=37657 RepID=UPI003D781F15